MTQSDIQWYEFLGFVGLFGGGLPADSRTTEQEDSEENDPVDVAESSDLH